MQYNLLLWCPAKSKHSWCVLCQGCAYFDLFIIYAGILWYRCYVKKFKYLTKADVGRCGYRYHFWSECDQVILYHDVKVLYWSTGILIEISSKNNDTAIILIWGVFKNSIEKYILCKIHAWILLFHQNKLIF